MPNLPFFREVEKNLQKKLKVTIHVQGGSMRPFLQNGDKVLLAPITTKKLSRGDIVLAYTSFGVLLHRIVRIRGETVWLAGDANNRRLEQTTRKDVFGVVDRACRKGKLLNVNSLSGRILAFFWYLLRPFRGYLLGGYYKLKQTKKKKK